MMMATALTAVPRPISSSGEKWASFSTTSDIWMPIRMKTRLLSRKTKRFQTVSYTHLDVYKRQIEVLTAPIAEAAELMVGCVLGNGKILALSLIHI